MHEWAKREIPDKACRPAESSSTIFTCENMGATPPGIEPQLLTSQLREPGSITGGVATEFSHAGIVPDDAAGRRVFSGISRFHRSFHSGAALYSPRFTHIGSQDLAQRTDYGVKTRPTNKATVTKSTTPAVNPAHCEPRGNFLQPGYAREHLSCIVQGKSGGSRCETTSEIFPYIEPKLDIPRQDSTHRARRGPIRIYYNTNTRWGETRGLEKTQSATRRQTARQRGQAAACPGPRPGDFLVPASVLTAVLPKRGRRIRQEWDNPRVPLARLSDCVNTAQHIHPENGSTAAETLRRHLVAREQRERRYAVSCGRMEGVCEIERGRDKNLPRMGISDGRDRSEKRTRGGEVFRVLFIYFSTPSSHESRIFPFCGKCARRKHLGRRAGVSWLRDSAIARDNNRIAISPPTPNSSRRIGNHNAARLVALVRGLRHRNKIIDSFLMTGGVFICRVRIKLLTKGV
ncbi:hypothetical protein PR048_025458 [Dryococelus australis]|uniref:Uncharacterized protein n=1 Tax=Dryococelus australis TaxID=614101 RepID=A0ABQ9GRB7_9NEOP|nr:hypothetical protein PR048_025458 [Dryococelus australis]